MAEETRASSGQGLCLGEGCGSQGVRHFPEHQDHRSIRLSSLQLQAQKFDVKQVGRAEDSWTHQNQGPLSKKEKEKPFPYL